MSEKEKKVKTTEISVDLLRVLLYYIPEELWEYWKASAPKMHAQLQDIYYKGEEYR